MDAGQITMMPVATTAALAGVSTEVGVPSPEASPVATSSFCTVLGNCLQDLFGAEVFPELLQMSDKGTVSQQQTVANGAEELFDISSTTDLESLGTEHENIQTEEAAYDAVLSTMMAEAYSRMALLQGKACLQQATPQAIPDKSGQQPEKMLMPVGTLEAAGAVPLTPDTTESSEQNVSLLLDTDTPPETKESSQPSVAVPKVSASLMQQDVAKRVEPTAHHHGIDEQPTRPLTDLHNGQENSASLQTAVTPVTDKSTSVFAFQKGADAQGQQEPAAGGKTAVASVSHDIRFSQPTDIAVSADTAGQDDVDSGEGRQEGWLSDGKLKPVPAKTEMALNELPETSVEVERPLENYLLTGSKISHSVTTDAAKSADPLQVLMGEQITRQVSERLMHHEIKQSNDQISLKLSPEHLGTIQLHLRMEDQRLKLEIVAENRGVRDALLQQSDELKETLARQNISVDSFSVTTGNGNSFSQQSRDWRQMSAEQRQHQPQYAGNMRTDDSTKGMEAPVQYFAHQYQSTIDVRF